ncbi:MAG: hypothetical protein ABMA13_16415 [Chthoniobacteraceae bacterium]
MKHILTTTILVATAFGSQANEKSITEKARHTAGAVVEKTKDLASDTKDAVVGAARRAGKAVRTGWRESKAYVSDETPVYHEGANTILASLGREIAGVKEQTPRGAPVYFRTRLQALDEQHAHLVGLLAGLSPEQLKVRSSGPRYEFDQCVGDLEDAIDQAKDGITTFPTIAAK